MFNELKKLETFSKFKYSDFKEEIDDFAFSETIAEIHYLGNLKVTVLKIAQSFIVTYELDNKKWTSNCASQNAVLKDVKTNIQLLRDTKIMPIF